MKAKKSISDDIRKAIELRAYYIWESEGCPDGKQQDHWALAEAEILSEPAAKKTPAAKAPAKTKTNGGAKKTKAEAVIAPKPVKTKKAAKTVKPAPKA